LTLAYAVTVHKSQGSEFETVILPVTNPGAWDRALLYTAITRAKTRVVILGSLDDVRSIAACVRPVRPSILYKTFLKHE
jgi:exodeoxyribonuclease V alpha subunit